MSKRGSLPPPKLGRPLAFETPQDLLDMFLDYIKECNEENKIPSMAGFRANKMIPKSTLNDYVNKPTFSAVYDTMLDLLEDIVLNKQKIETALQTLILKSKHKYTDKQEIDLKSENIIVQLIKST